MAEKKSTRRSFGQLRKLTHGSGRWQAQFTGPDGRVYKAPSTFAAKIDAEGWISERRKEIDRDLWSPPLDAATESKARERRTPFGEYAEDWLTHRELKERTREHYRKLLDRQILPTFGELPLSSITTDDVRQWLRKMGTATPTLKKHAFDLLKTILGTAVGDGRISANPCRIPGASTAKRATVTRPATLDELQIITGSMPERLRAMVLLASWCALRFGELTELRRKDIALDPSSSDDELRGGVIRIRRAVVKTGGAFVVTTPKSDAGRRDVQIPPHLVPVIESHLAEHVGSQPDALLFPADKGGHLAQTTLRRRFVTACAKAGRDGDLRFHDLRHTGAVLAAVSGATLAELMGRLGHSTPQAAMRYQHVAQGRDKAIAAALSALATTPTK